MFPAREVFGRPAAPQNVGFGVVWGLGFRV